MIVVVVTVVVTVLFEGESMHGVSKID